MLQLKSNHSLRSCWPIVGVLALGMFPLATHGAQEHIRSDSVRSDSGISPEDSYLITEGRLPELSTSNSNKPISLASFQDDDEATINISERGAIDLQALVQWAAELEGFELMLDDEAFQKATNKVVFFSRVKVNRKTVVWLVQEILRANGFALVDAPVPGWKRVASLGDVPPLVPTIPVNEVDQQEFEYVTAIFALENIDSTTAKNYLTSALPTKQPNTYRELGETRLLLVTDMVRNVRKVQKILAQIDVPTDSIQIEFYQVKHLEAKELSDQIGVILGTHQEFLRSPDVTPPASETSGRINLGSFAATSVKVSFDARTNRLVLVGKESAIGELKKLISQLDVPIGMELRTYQFRFVSASRIDALIKQSLSGTGEEISRVFQSTIDAQENRLTVSAGKSTHERIEGLRLQLDRPSQVTDEQSLLRFYKLKNVRVAEMVTTLQSIDRLSQVPRANPRTPQSGIRGREGFDLTGPNNFSSNFREGPPPLPPSITDTLNMGGSGSLFTPPGNTPRGNELGLDGLGSENLFGLGLADRIFLEERALPRRLIPGDAQLTIDEHTNTLIVVAEPEVQRLYEQLIQRLDVRRPQVLIEAHVVLIEGSDNLNLGVEISGGDRQGAKKLFAFSSFGLSEVDGTTGALSIIPGLGFNGTLVDPDTADVVIKALATHSRSRVVSSPKVVVDDNATGLLSSVAEQPFASVNASQTVATTSFAGFAQAGTTINVTPRISDDDYLNLDFDILVNTFTGTPAPNLPPPRNTDQVVSQVTIPDGYTVIVGGLNRQRIARSVAGLPFIERIPLIRHLASSRDHEYSDAMLFIFIKPTILRDDQFRDMIYLSCEEQEKAFLCEDYPVSRPQLIR